MSCFPGLARPIRTDLSSLAKADEGLHQEVTYSRFLLGRGRARDGEGHLSITSVDVIGDSRSAKTGPWAVLHRAAR